MRNKASVPREHLVPYQFSARGHEVAQAILGSQLDRAHDGAGAYYRSRPLLLSLPPTASLLRPSSAGLISSALREPIRPTAWR